MKMVAVLVFDDAPEDDAELQKLMNSIGTTSSYVMPHEPAVWLAIKDRAEKVIEETLR